MKNTIIKSLLVLIALCIIVMAGTLGYMLIEELDKEPTQKNTVLQQYETNQIQTTPKQTQSNYQTYKNKKLNFKINYPKAWRQVPINMNIGEKGVKGAIFLSPPDMKTGTAQVFEVITEDLPLENPTVNDYYRASREVLEVMLTGYKEIIVSESTIDGLPAKEIKSTFKQGVFEFEAKIIQTVKGKKGYIILYGALSENYNKDINTANKMINSFEFI